MGRKTPCKPCSCFLLENKPIIERTNHSMTANESQDVTLKCLLQSSVQTTSRFSISWFRESNNSNPELLVKIQGNGIIEYGSGNMSRRLHPYSPSVGDFRLTLQNVEMADAGTFYCQVEEWRTVDCSTSQIQQATGQSGYSRLVVLPSGKVDLVPISALFFISDTPGLGLQLDITQIA